MELGGAQGQGVLTWPADLRVAPTRGQPGRYTVRWHGERGARIYELQRGSNPTDEASFTTVYSDKLVKFPDEGQPGQVVWYRVRTQGNGVSSWSPAVSYLIR
jgi:hypothetical protein